MPSTCTCKSSTVSIVHQIICVYAPQNSCSVEIPWAKIYPEKKSILVMEKFTNDCNIFPAEDSHPYTGLLWTRNLSNYQKYVNPSGLGLHRYKFIQISIQHTCYHGNKSVTIAMNETIRNGHIKVILIHVIGSSFTKCKQCLELSFQHLLT